MNVYALYTIRSLEQYPLKWKRKKSISNGHMVSLRCACTHLNIEPKGLRRCEQQHGAKRVMGNELVQQFRLKIHRRKQAKNEATKALHTLPHHAGLSHAFDPSPPFSSPPQLPSSRRRIFLPLVSSVGCHPPSLSRVHSTRGREGARWGGGGRAEEVRRLSILRPDAPS